MSTRRLAARLARILPLVLLGLASRNAFAEPYFAINANVKCVACHVNPTGGGKRNSFGNVYGQATLSARPPQSVWDGRFNERVAVGGDLRANFDYVDIPNQDEQNAFNLEETLAYLELDLLPEELIFYVDQRIAPGSATNREAYALYWLRKGRLYVKAGRMFLPFGWRLEDDQAFIRQVPGINYTTPDTGVEVGVELARWSAQLALTNGTAGAGEVDSGKQISALASYIRPLWRVGLSLNVNDTEDGDRSMSALFAGLKTGPIAWLAEIDYIVDDTLAGDQREQVALFLEANTLIAKGHNIKTTYEYLEPDQDVDEDERTRISAVWEYFPVQYTQISTGLRFNDGIPQNDQQNATEFFVQLHNYF